jgi:ABC-type uncharacterized transport system ATPase subunit
MVPSRVGVVGPNGAGKSTMIKLLTASLLLFRKSLFLMGTHRVKQFRKRELFTNTLLCGLVTFPSMQRITLVNLLLPWGADTL